MKNRKLVLKLLSLALAVTLLSSAFLLSACGNNPTLPEYTITYELDGGTNHSDNPDKYTTEDLPMTIKAASKQSFIFEGWTGELNTEKQLTVEIPRNAKKNLTFTAHFKKIPPTEEGEYAIVYILDGGTNHNDNPDKYTADDLPLAIKEPTRDNHEFLGWTTDTVAEPTKNFEIPFDSETDLVLTANWKSLKPSEPENYGADKKRAPDITVTDMDGKEVSLTDFYGDKPVFISFWQTSCNVCLTEMRNHFNQVYEEQSDKFALLAIHIDDYSVLETHLKTNSYTFPIYYTDKNTFTALGYFNGGFPSNYVVDKWGYFFNTKNPNKDEAVTKFHVDTIISNSSMISLINGAIDRAR